MTESRKPPFFSVVVPVYNDTRYVGAALDSILAQSDSDWEALVVDDGSTDATPGIIEGYGRNDPRFRVFHKPNGGTATALNLGIENARGQWICWLSSDDLFKPDNLAVERRQIERHPDARFFFSLFETLDAVTGAVSDGADCAPLPASLRWPVLEMLNVGFVCGISTCVHRSAFEQVGRFDTDSRYGHDYDMYLRMVRLYPPVLIRQKTSYYRQHPQQGTARRRDEMFFDIGLSAIKFLNRYPFESWFAGMDWSDSEPVEAAFGRAMEVAANRYAFVYALGPHSALIGRIAEWLWTGDGSRRRGGFREHFGRCARAAALRSDGGLSSFWRAAAVAADTASSPWDCCPVSIPDYVSARCASLAAQRPDRVEVIGRFVRRVTGQPLAQTGRPGSAGREDKVLVLADAGARSGGLAHAAVAEIVRPLAVRGDDILVAWRGGSSLETIGASAAVGFRKGWRFWLSLAENGPFDLGVDLGGGLPRIWRVASRTIRMPESAADVVTSLEKDTPASGVARGVAIAVCRLSRVVGRVLRLWRRTVSRFVEMWRSSRRGAAA